MMRKRARERGRENMRRKKPPPGERERRGVEGLNVTLERLSAAGFKAGLLRVWRAF
jgi:hypothetical protein